MTTKDGIVRTLKEVNSIVAVDKSPDIDFDVAFTEDEMYYAYRKGVYANWVYVGNLEDLVARRLDTTKETLRGKYGISPHGWSPCSRNIATLYNYWYNLYLLIVPRVAEFEPRILYCMPMTTSSTFKIPPHRLRTPFPSLRSTKALHRKTPPRMSE